VHQTASGYHRSTEYDRDRMPAGGLNWSALPKSYKFYEGRPPLLLPRDFHFPDIPLYGLYAGESKGTSGDKQPDTTILSEILFLSYGLTARRRAVGEDFFFRSVPSAGALYPSEIYVGAWNVEGIPSGLYHFDTTRHALILLRKGDFQNVLDFEEVSRPPVSGKGVSFYISGIFFRSSWKYRKRAYRYVLMDAGHLIENLVLALKAYEITPLVSLDFKDEQASVLMGVDPMKEVCLAHVHFPGRGTPRKRRPASLSPLPSDIVNASTVSAKEIVFPEILDIHRSGNTLKRNVSPHGAMKDLLGIRVNQWEGLPRPPAETPGTSFTRTALNRRSHRNFIPEPLAPEVFACLMDLLASAATQQGDPPFESLLSLGFLAHAVEGLQAGFYLVDAGRRSFGRVRIGSFADPMASICLNQEWLKNAAVHFLFMTHTAALDRTWGPRGYRYAMIAAGRLGQAIYLACTALELGCCGIGAFYDGEARNFLSLDPEAALLYLVAGGYTRHSITS